MAINCRSRVPASILSSSSSSLPLSSVLFTVLGEFEVCSLHFTAYTLHFNLCPWRRCLYLPSLSPFLISINLQFGEYKLILGSIFDAIFRQFSLTQSEICLVSSKSALRFSEFLAKLQLCERERGNERKGVTIGNETFCIIFKVWKELQILIEFIRNGHEIELHESQHAAVLFVSICILNMNI